jgi:hypothetical protein
MRAVTFAIRHRSIRFRETSSFRLRDLRNHPHSQGAGSDGAEIVIGNHLAVISKERSARSS